VKRERFTNTLQLRFGEVVALYLTDGVLHQVSYKHVLESIHMSIVTENKLSLTSKLLGTASPDINPIEASLPRRTRTTLSQLRSTYCNDLKSYQNRIGSSPDELCPACRGTTHTTEHLFGCPSSPTDLGKLNLWKHPREAADFLWSLPSFDYLALKPPSPDSPEPPPLAQDAPV
jgi:hypothetical protein